MIFGYGRCSTNETKQDIDRQINELKKEGCEKVFVEYVHGDSKDKPQLSLLLDVAKEGDTIITTEVSRLARSTRQLCDIIDIILVKKLCLKVVGSICVDCRNGRLDPMTNAFIQMSGVFAELELLMIRDRVKSGMKNAKAKGSQIGRPKTTVNEIPNSFLKHYPTYKNNKINISEFARLTELSRATIYKYLSLLDTNTKT